MTAYFTDPMGDEFKKALEKALKQAESKKGEDDPDATKRATESRGKRKSGITRGKKESFSRREKESLR